MFTTADFVYTRRTRVFVAEASRLGFPAGQNPPDSIIITNPATERSVTFTAWDLVEDQDEGELKAWVYRPTDTTLDCEVHILND